MAASMITTETTIQDRAAQRLTGSRSADGKTIFVPARPIDPADPLAELETVELSGRGTLVSFSVVPVASSEMIAAGYGRDNPHAVGIVRLEEGPCISAQIIGIDMKHPDTVAPGLAMKAEFIERTAGATKKIVLAFRPA
ncbi:MAG: Zn-ribbon domain-containing OB-fold protein [Acidobacteriota bacterium]